jgi:hypothetical protein
LYLNGAGGCSGPDALLRDACAGTRQNLAYFGVIPDAAAAAAAAAVAASDSDGKLSDRDLASAGTKLDGKGGSDDSDGAVGRSVEAAQMSRFCGVSVSLQQQDLRYVRPKATRTTRTEL